MQLVPKPQHISAPEDSIIGATAQLQPKSSDPEEEESFTISQISNTLAAQPKSSDHEEEETITISKISNTFSAQNKSSEHEEEDEEEAFTISSAKGQISDTSLASWASYSEAHVDSRPPSFIQQLIDEEARSALAIREELLEKAVKIPEFPEEANACPPSGTAACRQAPSTLEEGQGQVTSVTSYNAAIAGTQSFYQSNPHWRTQISSNTAICQGEGTCLDEISYNSAITKQLPVFGSDGFSVEQATEFPASMHQPSAAILGSKPFAANAEHGHGHDAKSDWSICDGWPACPPPTISCSDNVWKPALPTALMLHEGPSPNAFSYNAAISLGDEGPHVSSPIMAIYAQCEGMSGTEFGCLDIVVAKQWPRKHRYHTKQHPQYQLFQAAVLQLLRASGAHKYAEDYSMALQNCSLSDSLFMLSIASLVIGTTTMKNLVNGSIFGTQVNQHIDLIQADIELVQSTSGSVTATSSATHSSGISFSDLVEEKWYDETSDSDE